MEQHQVAQAPKNRFSGLELTKIGASRKKKGENGK
jgi:hypothetical protein